MPSVRGSDPAKARSPCISFSEPTTSAKSYGKYRIQLDKDRLQSDIAAGKVNGVRIIEFNELVDVLKNHVAEAEARYASNPTRSNLLRLEAAKQDLQNASRDREFLIESTIPKGYFSVSLMN